MISLDQIYNQVKKKERRCKYIVFEGIDGGGKTTQTLLLRDYIKSKGRKVLLVCHPSKEKGSLGRYIREHLFLEENSSLYIQYAIAASCAADRMILYDKEIIPAVISGCYDFVISDRSFYSGVVSQPIFGVSENWIKQLIKYELLPDITIILDISKEEYMKRKGNTNIVFEKEWVVEEGIERYRSLPNNFPDHNIHIINGEGTKEEVHNRIINLLKDKGFL